jgi:hypothetical protein
VFFGSKTIRVHILKGLLGFVALYVALSTMHRTIWPSLVLLPVVLYLLKGCPMCWTMGLIETIVMAVHKRNERKFPSAHGQPGFDCSR